MKKLVVGLVSLLLATLPLVGCSSERIASATKDSVVSLSDSSGYPFCTGVAIGKHLVWTKAHCMGVTPATYYNGRTCPTDKVVVDDGHDNVLVETCQSYTKLAKIAKHSPKVGESVYFWGHAARLPALYRVGHVSFVGPLVPLYPMGDDSEGPIYIFDFQGHGGDSGGPVFNSRGEVLCTLKGGIVDKLPYCVSHHFTKDQLRHG